MSLDSVINELKGNNKALYDLLNESPLKRKEIISAIGDDENVITNSIRNLRKLGLIVTSCDVNDVRIKYFGLIGKDSNYYAKVGLTGFWE